MSSETHDKERQIMRKLRTVLGNIVKDTAPRPGVPSPLQEATVASIRELFAMIAEREGELARLAGATAVERPHYADEPQETSVVKLHPPGADRKPH